MKILLLGFLLVASAWGQESLTLQQVLESVQKSFPSVEIAKAEIDKAKYELKSFRGSFDPNLKLSTTQNFYTTYDYNYFDGIIEQALPFWGSKLFGGYRYGAGNFPNYDLKYQTYDSGELRAGIELSLLKNGLYDETRTRLKNQRQILSISELSKDLTLLEAIREASLRYWLWKAAGEKESCTRELLEIALKRDAWFDSLLKRGDISKLQRIENLRQIYSRKAGLVSAERNRERAQLDLELYFRDLTGNLVELINYQASSNWNTPTSITQTNSEEINQIIKNHPEYQRLSKRLSIIDQELRLADNQILPKLDLNFAGSYDVGELPTNTSRIAPKTELRFHANFEMPFFFRTGIGKRDSINVSLLQTKRNLSFVRERLQLAIVNAQQALQAAHERIELTSQELELAERLKDQEHKRFLAGDSDLITINIREKDYLEAKINNIDALFDYERAQIEQNFALAKLTQ